MISPRVLVAPTIEPVTVEWVKLHLRITQSIEDALIGSYIAAARHYFEWVTGRTLHQTTFLFALPDFPRSNCPIALPRASPLISVSAVEYLDSDGGTNTWPSASYLVDTFEDIGRIAPAYGSSYPSFTPFPLNAVRITYLAGIANGSPQKYSEDGIQQCILELVGTMYENREHAVLPEIQTGQEFVVNPLARMLLQQYTVAYAF